MKRDLYDLSVEISSASMIIKGLSNQLDYNDTDVLKPESLRMALFGVSEYLSRIASNLTDLSQ